MNNAIPRPSTLRISLALLAITWPGCLGDPPPLYGDSPAGGGLGGPVTPVEQELTCAPDSTQGVPHENHPTYAERLAVYAMDRARTEPGRTGWPDFPAAPPALWSKELNDVARVHSVDMRDTPCFQHDSCDGTKVFDRIKSYLTSPYMTLGENIAAGMLDPIQVIERSWINEVGAPPGETGHRENMFNRAFNYVGLGYGDGGSKYRGYWTQDLMGSSAPSPWPRVPVGSHYPAGGPEVTFGVVVYEPNGVAPDRVDVIIDGKATTLDLFQGKEAFGAYEGRVTLPNGCHRYRFRAIFGKEASCYPARGFLGAGTSDAGDCADWQAGN